MKNVLFKNIVMNNSNSIQKTLIGLRKPILEIEYSLSQRSGFGRISKEQLHQNNINLEDQKIETFDYRGINFNMIVCLPGEVKSIASVDYDSSKKGYVLTMKSQKVDKAFMLGETEVTQELFEAVMGYNYSKFQDNHDFTCRKPVETTTWYDCIDFCNRLSILMGRRPYYSMKKIKLGGQDSMLTKAMPKSILKAVVAEIPNSNGFRLPSESEWQLAYAAGKSNQYAEINNPAMSVDIAWFGSNSGGQTHLVAQKKPNEAGFYDMNGNVWEWCWDASSADKNKRIALGGGYDSPMTSMITPNSIDMNIRIDFIGFRIALD
jgi:hypothetical protein